MKKLDAAYFGIKKKELEMFIWVRGRLTIPTALMSEALHLLEQIARDGFNAGAEAQRHQCFPDCAASNSCPCDAATVEFEEGK